MTIKKTWMVAMAACAMAGQALACDESRRPASHGEASREAPPKASSAPVAGLTDGEVEKIDLELGKATIRHEAIANLKMPPMTMVFKAAKPELIANLKPGDKIRFSAESAGGALSLVRVEKAD